MPPQDFLTNRGEPWEYDPGPPANRTWARLFAETPNYRGLGHALSGRDEFRWHFGPMFYRGRLADGGAKVLVIGQEGAQDESLGRRSFLGGTGARMQHFLTHLGIARSYLFLNTFVYPIFGQYDGKELLWLAQNPRSPLVKHRHAILDYVLERHDLRLIVAVGRAAKESVHSWVKSRGGNCPAGKHDVDGCAASALGARVRVVGVVHPGAGGKGASTATIITDFKKALRQIAEWDASDPSWLPVDPGATRGMPDDYKYRSAPIPFRDLPYGISWRVGQGGTSSNRKDAQRGIQMFSEAGDYATTVAYPNSAAGTDEGYAEQNGDLPYEPPRQEFDKFDAGPPAPFARLMMGGDSGLAWPDFASLGVTSHESFGYGPIYRGRPESARVLILADQDSHDDLFTGRALTGEGGQHFQGFLRAMGLDRSYLTLRVLPVDTLDLTTAQVDAIVDHPQVRKVYQAIVARVLANGQTTLALTIGPHAKRLAAHVLPTTVPVVELLAWKTPGALANWKNALQQLQTKTYAKDAPATFSYDGERAQIPRIDLPYGTLRWMGSSGDRGVRAEVSGKPSPHYYKILMPRWAFNLGPRPLSDAEEQAIEQEL
jgi:uracil-DNA glycosylase